MRTWPDTIQTLKQYPASRRFEYAKVAVDGNTLFLKQAKTELAGKGFSSELAWNEFISELQHHYPALNVRVPDLFSYQPDVALMSEFIDAPLLTRRHEVDELYAQLERYVDVLLAIDSLGVGYTTSLPDRTDRISYKSLDKQWQSWFNSRTPAEMVRYEQLLSRAQKVFNDTPVLTACMQMGDFVPWHIFNNDGEWIIFDSEHAHHQWPRFYDLAYSFTRIYTHQKNHAVAQEMLRKFIEKLDMPKDEFWKQFTPVLLSRAVGVLSDALSDAPGDDYIVQAEALLQRCLDDPQTVILQE